MNNGSLTGMTTARSVIMKSDPSYARLLRNIERFTQLAFDAFENEQSCTLTLHLQKGRAAGFKVEFNEPPTA